MVQTFLVYHIVRKQPPRGVLKKGVLKICSKFTGEHPCQSVTSKKLQINVIAGWLLLTVPLSGIILRFIIQFSTTKSCFWLFNTLLRRFWKWIKTQIAWWKKWKYWQKCRRKYKVFILLWTRRTNLWCNMLQTSERRRNMK